MIEMAEPMMLNRNFYFTQKTNDKKSDMTFWPPKFP